MGIVRFFRIEWEAMLGEMVYSSNCVLYPSQSTMKRFAPSR